MSFSHRVIQKQMWRSVLRCVTRAEGLQEPCASRPAWCAGFRLSGTEGSDGLDVGLVVTCGRDLQHRDDCTLVQQAVRCHHFSVAFLTAAHSRLKTRKEEHKDCLREQCNQRVNMSGSGLHLGEYHSMFHGNPSV